MRLNITWTWVWWVLVYGLSHASAQLPEQSILLPESGDFGTFATQDESLGFDDPLLHKAYDNFSIGGTATIDGIRWAGIFSEPIPSASPSRIDFIVEIWQDEDGFPAISSGPVGQWELVGGVAGISSATVTKIQLDHVSRATPNTVGGGPAFEYSAELPSFELAPGDYWISIIGDQGFDNVAPIFDPEWQWHFGSGPGDGHVSFSRESDVLENEETDAGIFMADADLSFSLLGEVTELCEDPRVQAGDFNQNGTVEFADFLLLSTNFGLSGPGIVGDTNCNSSVEFADFLVLSQNFGQAVGSVRAVPEPTTSVFAFALFMVLMLRVARRQLV